MRIRVPDVLLLIATLVGAVRLTDTTKNLSQLRSEYTRVIAFAGEMEIKDPNLLHIVAIESDDPWHFMWRVYMPANYNVPFHLAVGGSSGTSSSSNSDAREFIARLRINTNRTGRTELYSSFGSGSSLMSFGSPEFIDFLDQHRSELKIEQVGANGMQTFKPGEAVTLLKIIVPDELAAEAQNKFESQGVKYLLPVLVDARIGGR